MNVAELKLVSILIVFASEDKFVATTVDLIEPFLLDAVYGKLHTIGEISSTCLEFNFNLRDWIYRFYKFERLEVSGRKSTGSNLLEQGNSFDYIALARGICTVNNTDLQCRYIISSLRPADMSRVNSSFSGNETD
jgi:hypothetical protein